MTLSDTLAPPRSKRESTTRLKPLLLLLGGLTAATVVSGCTGPYKSDFSVVVVNRTANTIQVTANASELGQVAPGQQASFSLRLTESNPNEFTNGVAPTPQGEVTFTAKDLKTGALSTPKSMALSKGSPTYVTFAAADFPAATTTPTVARFTFSPTTPAPNQDVTFNAAASTPATGTFAWNFGDGSAGSGVTIAHRYAQPGSYIVTLSVASETGQVAVATSTVTVSTALPPATQVNFTFSPSAPAVNQDVFFNASTSNVSGGTFVWDFGDGGTGTGVTVTHRFVRAGTYTVTLTVANAPGQSRAVSRPVAVSTSSPQVVATFIFSPTNPGINQEVFFDAEGSRPTNATFAWNFGDGSSGTGVTPTHRYSQAGTYAVALTVTNDVGQSSTTSRTVTVSATSGQVVASFVFSPTNPGINQDVFFDAAASRPSSGTFTWDFGDGTRGSGITPTHRYTQAGAYTVLLTVTNDFGQSATTTRTVTVLPTSPLVAASFTFSPTTAGINQEVFFDASASRPSTGTFTWNFGDGSSGSGIRPTHRFAQAGNFTVTLTVANEFGQTSTTSRTITVTATSSQVVATFTFSPTAPGINQEVFFNASASNPSNGTFTWNFGDGSAGSGVTPTHRFALAGTYTVTLTVTNNVGQTSTTSRTVTVSATSSQVVASFTFSPTTPGINQEVFFNGTASTPSTGTFTWNFGDGTGGSGIQPTHRFAQAGTYTVTLTVTNENSQTSTTSKTVSVSASSTDVVASFTFSPTAPGINQDVFFNATASTPSNGTFAWNFGDGSSGSGVTPTHRFTSAATYTVALTVTNNLGQSSTTSKTITVSATSSEVVASFTFSPTTPGLNQQVFFNASASTPSNAAYSWSFGDGSAGTGITPTHRYNPGGTYTVTLTVTFNGQSSTTSKTITVSATSTQISPSFTYSPTSPKVGTQVFFNASGSSAASGIAGYEWDFGDGCKPNAEGSSTCPTGSTNGNLTNHTYQQAGTYVVRLTVRDNEGNTNSTTSSVTVTQ